MPTVLEEGGFRIKVFGPPREHGPSHVHAYKGLGVAVIRLAQGGKQPVIWKVYDMRPADVAKAFRIVQANAEKLRKAWEAIHG